MPPQDAPAPVVEATIIPPVPTLASVLARVESPELAFMADAYGAAPAPSEAVLRLLSAPVTITLHGAAFGDGTTLENLVDVVRAAAKVARVASFTLADAMNYAEDKFPDAPNLLETFAAATCMDVKTLANIKRVGRNVPHALRRDGLDFEHHRAVAALPDIDKQHWLAVAEDEGLSKRELRKSILLGRVVKKDAKADPGIQTVGPLASKIRGLVEGLEKAGKLATADATALYLMHSELMPVLKAHAKIVKQLQSRGCRTTLKAFGDDLKKLMA